MATATQQQANVDVLYNGEVELRFDKAKHRYYAWEIQEGSGAEIHVPSVTQILDVLNKPALMYWAVNCAVDMFKMQVKPGVSYDEIEISAIAEMIRTQFRTVSKKAIDIGALVHEWVAAYVADPSIPLPINEQAKRCCQQVQEWMRSEDYIPTHTERKIYSRKHKYAGTLDACSAARIRGRSAIVDWKTSKAIYPEYRLQVAAYKSAWEEMTGERGLDCWIVRFDKEGNGMEPVQLPRSEYRRNIKCFLACKEVYEHMASMKAA